MTPATPQDTLPPPPATDTSAATDRTALIALYNATGGPNWTNNTNWLSNETVDEWHGVTIDDDGRLLPS